MDETLTVTYDVGCTLLSDTIINLKPSCASLKRAKYDLREMLPEMTSSGLGDEFPDIDDILLLLDL